MVPAMTAMAMTAMAAAAGASASTTAPTAAAAPAPELVVEAAKGFIDDPVTFDPDGDRVAVIETDSSSFARVRVIDLATGKDARSPPLPDPRLVFDRLLFTGSQGGIVVVSRRPDGARLAELFALDGMRLGQAGPASDFAVAMRAGQRHLVAWTTRPAAGGGTAATVTPHRLDTLAPAGKPRVLALGADGGLPKPPLSFWGWQDGYTRIAGQLPGGYDAKTDVRQPARAAVFDVLDSAVIEEKPIGDVEAWVRARELRRTRPNRSLFLVADAEAATVDLVDARGRRHPVALAAPLSQYDAGSLVEQEDAASGTLFFGLATDPLHPEALARRKADAVYLDVYRGRITAAPGGGASGAIGASTGADTRAPAAVAERILRVPVDDRPVSWVAGRTHVAVSRRHKGFARGATRVEIHRHRLPQAATKSRSGR